MKIKAVGDRGVLLELGETIDETVNRQVMELNRSIMAASIEGVTETVPAFCSVLVCYDPLITDYELLSSRLEELSKSVTSGKKSGGRLVKIPVCYGGESGPDLSFVAEHAGRKEREVIQIHSSRDYRIYMLGFLPGFPYLGGLDKRIHTPRLTTPRTKIPAGSVGIGGEQTGIYPMESPGGWQLIGRTPLKLFDVKRAERPLYEAGDTIRFIPITLEEYHKIRQEQEKR